MTDFDPNIVAVARVAAALGPLMDELVLVGGCAVGLLITDHAISPIRATVDVDLVAEVASLAGYYELGDRLKQVGFAEYGDPTCRWVSGPMLIDVVPTQDTPLSPTNPWYASAARNALDVTLATGQPIRLIAAPYFLATKLVAFRDRGKGDYMHHDMEDIITIVNGRPEVVAEVNASEPDVKAFLQEEFEDLILDSRFVEQLEWFFDPDGASQARVPTVLGRLRQLSGS
jgi:predicted nucleotidyltransferase